jgi:hypothetical protein
MEFFDVLDRIKPSDLVAQPLFTDPHPNGSPTSADQLIPRQQSRALVIDTPDKTVITVGVESAALDPEEFLTRITGRLVGAEQANDNGQFWAAEDLEFGIGSVAHGPLNWLHNEHKIIGCLTGASLVERATSASAAIEPTHIRADAVMWSYLFPGETMVVREAAAASKLFYSMECVSKNVQCAGPNGCGATMAYTDAHNKTEKACAHIRDRASYRRFIKPAFQGAAVIVPPVQPGWSNASADVLRRVGASKEGRALAAFTDDEVLASQILKFIANGR